MLPSASVDPAPLKRKAPPTFARIRSAVRFATGGRPQTVMTTVSVSVPLAGAPAATGRVEGDGRVRRRAVGPLGPVLGGSRVRGRGAVQPARRVRGRGGPVRRGEPHGVAGGELVGAVGAPGGEGRGGGGQS